MSYEKNAREAAKRQIDKILKSNDTPEAKYIELLKKAFDFAHQICRSAVDYKYLDIHNFLCFEFAKNAMIKQNLYKVNFDNWPENPGVQFLIFARNSALELVGAFIAKVSSCISQSDEKHVLYRLGKGSEEIDEKDIDVFFLKLFKNLRESLNLKSEKELNCDCASLTYKFYDEIKRYGTQTTEKKKLSSCCKHSDDFTSVVWYGQQYNFNKTQALCVKLLWEQWEKDCPSLSEKTIGEKIGSSSDKYRLIHTFTKNGKRHLAWKKMIQSAGKGMFMLSEPPQKNTSKI